MLQAEGYAEVVKATLEGGLSKMDFWVFGVLLDSARTNGIVFRTQREIAKAAGTHQPNVNKALKALEVLGFISRVRGRVRIAPEVCTFHSPQRKQP